MAKPEYTPVVARRSKVVHAVAVALKPLETACGKRFESGWRIALKPLGCRDCKLAVGMDARPRARAARRRAPPRVARKARS